MKKLMSKLAERTNGVFKSKRGSGIIELIVIFSFIAFLAVVTLTPIGTSIKTNATSAITRIDNLVNITGESK